MTKPPQGFVKKPQAPRQLTAEEKTIISRAPNYNPPPQSVPPAPKAAEETKRLAIDMPLSMHRTLKAHCVEEGIVMRDLTLKLVQEYLDSLNRG